MTKRLQLSSFDLFPLGMVIDGAWIYEVGPDEKKMRTSLAKLAQIYPVLTAYYNSKTQAVEWEENTSEVLELETLDLSAYTKSQLMGNRRLTWSLVKPFDIKAYKKGKARGFRATLGKLQDGAVLYVQVAHCLMDGSGFYTLMKHWACLYKGEQITEMKIEREPLPAKDHYSKTQTLTKVVQQGWPEIGLGKALKMVFLLIKGMTIKTPYIIEIRQEELKELKAQTGAGTHAVLSALAAQALMAKPQGGRSLQLLTVCDLRGHFPGIDASYMGNFSQPVMALGQYSTGTDFPTLAREMDADFKSVLHSQAIEEMLRLLVCASHYKLRYFYFDASQMNCKNPGILYVNNQLKFRACELDWGLGTPCYAFPNGLNDMVKFWQPVSGGPIQIIFAGITAQIMG